MAYLATTCTPAELDAQISTKLADSGNLYWSASEISDARNHAVLGLYPRFRLKAKDISLTSSVSTNSYTLPAAITAVGDDAVVAVDINGVIVTDWEVWNGTLYSPRQGVWTVAKTIAVYYTKPFTVPVSTTTDVPPVLQPLVVLRACLELVDKKIMEANKGLSAHWFQLKRQWANEAEQIASSVEANQKYFNVAGEILYDGGHGK